MATPATTSAPLSLPPLPYVESALEPVISAKTLSFHHGKHHRTYVENANKLIAGTDLADLPLDRIVTSTQASPSALASSTTLRKLGTTAFTGIASCPRGRRTAHGATAQNGGGIRQRRCCKKALASNAVSQFGSGWAWLRVGGFPSSRWSRAPTPILR